MYKESATKESVEKESLTMLNKLIKEAQTSASPFSILVKSKNLQMESPINTARDKPSRNLDGVNTTSADESDNGMMSSRHQGPKSQRENLNTDLSP